MQVPVRINGCVLGLQVAVHDRVFVEVLENEEEAAEVETGRCVFANAQIGEEVKEIAPLDVAEE